MKVDPPIDPEPGTGALIGGILHDANELLGQQVEMFRSEVRQELRQLRTGMVSVCVGVGIAVAGALFIFVMLVQLLAAKTTLPLWACYGVVGGGLALIGVAFLSRGKKSVSDVHLAPPPATAQALKENVAWLKNVKHAKTAEPTL